MDTDSFKEIIGKQLIGALKVVGQSIESFDEPIWSEEHIDGSISQAVYHTLFYADLYLNKSPEGFKEQTFHLQNGDFFQDYQEERDEVPTNQYGKEGCIKYLGFCIDKVGKALALETEESLSGPSGFRWYKCSRAELYLINMRHIQHHGAQLGLRKQLAHMGHLKWESGL